VMGRVGSAISCLGFGFGKFPLKMSNFFPLEQKKSLRVVSKGTRVKGGSASYLLRVKSKLGLGQGPSLVKRRYSFTHNLKSLSMK